MRPRFQAIVDVSHRQKFFTFLLRITPGLQVIDAQESWIFGTNLHYVRLEASSKKRIKKAISWAAAVSWNKRYSYSFGRDAQGRMTITMVGYDFVTDTPKLVRSPGTRIMRLIRFFYGKKSISRIFDPIHADFIEEYFEALEAGEKSKSRWIRVRYYWAFLSASGLLSFVGVAKKVVKFWQQVA